MQTNLHSAVRAQQACRHTHTEDKQVAPQMDIAALEWRPLVATAADSSVRSRQVVVFSPIISTDQRLVALDQCELDERPSPTVTHYD